MLKYLAILAFLVSCGKQARDLDWSRLQPLCLACDTVIKIPMEYNGARVDQAAEWFEEMMDSGYYFVGASQHLNWIYFNKLDHISKTEASLRRIGHSQTFINGYMVKQNELHFVDSLAQSFQSNLK